MILSTRRFAMPRLTLICHGPAPAMRAAAFPRDEELEEGALDGMASLRSQLRPADRVLTSPALRARQTASALGLDAVIDPALADLDAGDWAGRPLAEIQAAAPADVALWLADEAATPHGGESRAALGARVARWLDGLSDGRGHTVAITHAAVIRMAALHVLDAPAAAFWRIDIAPLSLTAFSFDGRRFAIRMLGATFR